tara:strand:+ start:146 stop:334 length:189 start_codon:yes stop_codon:yes gene_type:complete
MKLSKKNESIDLFQTPIEMAKQLYEGISESIDERITVPKKKDPVKEYLKSQGIRMKDIRNAR